MRINYYIHHEDEPAYMLAVECTLIGTHSRKEPFTNMWVLQALFIYRPHAAGSGGGLTQIVPKMMLSLCLRCRSFRAQFRAA
jgi:hypothetical protein